MIDQLLPQGIVKAAGEKWGCFFFWNSFDIEKKMIKEKILNSSFGEASSPNI